MFQKRKRKDEYSMSIIVVDQFPIRLFDVCMCVYLRICVYMETRDQPWTS